ncbi:ABC transporter permease [Nanchangia anserum]|uniref:Transport permease protein n=2 Tax=Nanchangia anserum TaxID=2692125 RepID=A0A8I0GDQ6_9ACTO|nr:ABC transporter permease [Nanchangia anserum]MBD3690086.1 ABC transporter permease [Nanchangia anserum]QOX82555.1 ABC transporter permease [Nanchangia anserum]
MGLIEVFRKRFLLNLLVHKELRVRYRGSILGMIWSYAKPATQFLVFYFAIGVFMQMNRNIENYIVYMFAGVVIINYFSEAFGNCTRSLVGNQDLVKKIYLPRELFPCSSVIVAIIHFLPQVAILIIGALVMGWRPGVTNIAAVFAGFAIVTVFALGLGLLGAALNVLYRDTENFVDLILMVVTWASPVLYRTHMVEDTLGSGWLMTVYNLNPLTPAVELFHYGFWSATEGITDPVPPHLVMWSVIALAVSFLFLVIGEATFRHFDGRFAQEL